MSSIATSNPERTNRWLLIGAALLALVAGGLVAIVLSNAGGGNSSSKSASTGTSTALVAKNTIAANTTLTKDMFDQVKVDTLVPGAVVSETDAVGRITRADILKGEQISYNRLGLGDVKDKTLAPSIPPGMMGFPARVDEAGSVAGLIVPGDHVDVVVVFKQPNGGPNGTDLTRVQTVLQNIEVLAFAQDTVETTPQQSAQATPLATLDAGATVRRDDLKPNPGARTATLALTPQQVQTIAAVQDKGQLLLALRRLGDDTDHKLITTLLGDFGFVAPTPGP